MSQSNMNNVQNGEDRRQYSRVEFEAQVTLKQGGEVYQAELIDISLNGALTSMPQGYDARTDKVCELTVMLSADAVIVLQVVLVHNSLEYLGFQCTSIDMDSIVVLRRLIEVNLDDPAASERVLAELLKRQQDLSA